MEIDKCEKLGLTPLHPHPRGPVVKYLPAHFFTDWVSDLGVHVGVKNCSWWSLDILMYSVGMLEYSTKQTSRC